MHAPTARLRPAGGLAPDAGTPIRRQSHPAMRSKGKQGRRSSNVDHEHARGYCPDLFHAAAPLLTAVCTSRSPSSVPPSPSFLFNRRGGWLAYYIVLFPARFFSARWWEKKMRGNRQRGDGASSSIGGMPPKRQGPAGPTAREQAALNMKSAGEQLLYRVALGAVLAVTGALTFFPPMC